MVRAKSLPLGRITLAIDPQAAPFTHAALRELLDHAGLFVHEVHPEALPAALADPIPQVVVLAGGLTEQKAAPLREALSRFLERGGGLVGLGGGGAPEGQSGEGVLNGILDLFGLRPLLNPTWSEPGIGQSTWQTLGEGWLRLRNPRHPVLAGLQGVPLHVYGGQAVGPAKGSQAKVLAEISGLDGRKSSCATLTECAASRGRGTALFVAADLAKSAAHIRMGRPVYADAVSASDGSAPLADGLLKAEDGFVLDFLRDRRCLDLKGKPARRPGPDSPPLFDQPIADALALLLLRTLYYAASRTGVRLLRLWYHPDGLPAVGHISHDTDGNVPALGDLLYQVMADLEVRSTWCTIHPGYDAAFYGKLKAFGHEIALHYDAMGKPAQDHFRTWGREQFTFQHAWLAGAADLHGAGEYYSNKNHYTRWEGGLEFLDWCGQLGLRVDQSRGPSKRGMSGFPFGSCHPHFLYDPRGRRVPVLELPFQMQDLAHFGPAQWGPLFVDRALSWHGVCHLLIHPAHIDKPKVAQGLHDVVVYGRKRGLSWRTSREIGEFEFARRACMEAGLERSSEGGLRLSAPQALLGATLLVLGKDPIEVVTDDGGKAVADKKPVNREGFTWSQVRMDRLAGSANLK